MISLFQLDLDVKSAETRTHTRVKLKLLHISKIQTNAPKKRRKIYRYLDSNDTCVFRIIVTVSKRVVGGTLSTLLVNLVITPNLLASHLNNARNVMKPSRNHLLGAKIIHEKRTIKPRLKAGGVCLVSSSRDCPRHSNLHLELKSF